ncbi:MAG: type II toxin-antitoxin system VapC family toxin, partial [Candidatus Micrarchaeaceae archaeon]
RDAYVSGRIAMFEPSLVIYEILNAIRYTNTRKFTIEQLKTVIQSLHQYQFSTAEINYEFAAKSAEISLKYGISIYDAAYIALAQATGSEFYTADDRLIKAVGLRFVKHIKNFKIR